MIDPGSSTLARLAPGLRPVDQHFVTAARASLGDIKAVGIGLLDVARFIGGFAAAAVIGAGVLGAMNQEERR